MSLSAILSAIERNLPGVQFKDGVEHLAGNASPPRIVWGQIVERFGAPDPRWIGTPRALHTREVVVDTHLWGDDRDAVEKLLNGLVWAVRQAVGPNYRLSSGRWPQGAEKLVQKGETYFLPIAFLVPVTAPPDTTATPTILDADVAPVAAVGEVEIQ